MNFKHLLLLNILSCSFILNAKPKCDTPSTKTNTHNKLITSEKDQSQKLITVNFEKLFILLLEKNLTQLKILSDHAQVQTKICTQLFKKQIDTITAFMIENFGEKSSKKNTKKEKIPLRSLFKKFINSFKEFSEKQEVTSYKLFLKECNELLKNSLPITNLTQENIDTIPSHNFAKLALFNIKHALQTIEDPALSNEEKDTKLKILMSHLLLDCNQVALKKLGTELKNYSTNLTDSKKLKNFSNAAYATLLPIEKNLVRSALIAATNDLDQLKIKNPQNKSSQDPIAH